VKLADGREVIADENFIRDCILVPSRQYVAGYPPIMPSFQGQLSEEQLLKIIDYIKSLKAPGQAAPTQPSPVMIPNPSQK
jgi:cytochrome c oxidase subunit 2